MRRPRYKFLDTVVVRFPSNKRSASYRALVIESRLSDFGDTYRLQWNDGSETVMHGRALRRVKP